jgi:flagellar motor switch protein FliN/FliY
MDTTETNKNEQPQNEKKTTPDGPQQEDPRQRPGDKSKLDFLFDVPLKVSVEVGRAMLLVKDLLKMQEGYVIELDKTSGEPLDLYVNSRLIARGEAVLVNDRFGIRLTEVVSPSERLEKLG